MKEGQMRSLHLAVVCFLLFIPVNSSANAIDLYFATTVDDDSISFGLDPFRWNGDIGFASANGIELWDLNASISLTSGPLRGLVIDDSGEDPISTYSYGAGTLVIEGSRNGEPFRPFRFTAVTNPFSFSVCEGCDSLFGGSLAENFSLFVGAGFFNRAFANYLGAERITGGGDVYFQLEAIDGTPASTKRNAYDSRGYSEATVSAGVPEPGLFLLSLAGGVAWLARRRALAARDRASARA
jgi:hypothetical protein